MLQEIYVQHNVRDKLIVQQTTNLGTENLQHFINYLLNIMVVLIYFSTLKGLTGNCELPHCMPILGHVLQKTCWLNWPKKWIFVPCVSLKITILSDLKFKQRYFRKRNWLDWCLSEDLHYHSVELNLEISHWACKVTLTFQKWAPAALRLNKSIPFFWKESVNFLSHNIPFPLINSSQSATRHSHIVPNQINLSK